MAPPFFFSFGKGFPAIEAVFSLFFGIHPTRPFYPLFPPYGGSSKSTHPPPPSEKNRKHAIKDAEGFDVTANPEQIFFPKNLSDDQRLGWFQMVRRHHHVCQATHANSLPAQHTLQLPKSLPVPAPNTQYHRRRQTN